MDTRGQVIKIEFSCGMRDEMQQFEDEVTEDDVQEAFDVWLGNRSDIGWSVKKGKLAE